MLRSSILILLMFPLDNNNSWNARFLQRNFEATVVVHWLDLGLLGHRTRSNQRSNDGRESLSKYKTVVVSVYIFNVSIKNKKCASNFFSEMLLFLILRYSKY